MGELSVAMLFQEFPTSIPSLIAFFEFNGTEPSIM